MSTNPNENQPGQPGQPGQVPGQNGQWWSSEPWYDQPTAPDQSVGSDPGASGGQPTMPFGPPAPTQPSDASQGYGPMLPGGMPHAGMPGGPMQGGPMPGGYDPNYGQNYGPNQGAPYGQFGPPPMEPAPFYIGYEQQQPQQPSHTGRNVAAVLGAVGVVGTLAIVLVLTTNHHPSTSNAASTGTSSASASASVTDTETDTAQPTDTSTGDDSEPTATDTDTSDDYPTGSAFDPSTMDNASTDTAPFTTDALLPQTFTDSKGIEYQLEAGGVEDCIQDSMTSNVQNELRKYGCSQVLTGSYTVDSDTVTSDENILVSVQVFAFQDEATAKTVYEDFPSDKSWDFGIWCPKTGDGAKPCASNADYTDAYKSMWIGQDYRYVIEATALYTDLTSDSSVQEWTSAAAKEAVDEAGPTYYIASQD